MKLLPKIFFLFFSIISAHCFSQQPPVHVDAVLDTAKMRIGEQVKLDLYVTYNANQKGIAIQWPSIGDTLTGKVEVVSASPVDTTFPDKTNSSKVFQHQQLLLSVYDSGYYAIPSFEFILNNDTANPLLTRPLFLEVHTVPTDSSATKIKDIKPVFGEPFNWKWYLSYIYWSLGILFLLGLAIALIIYFRRRRKEVFVEPPKPKIPAHITALAALERIKAEQVWKEGRVKEYYSSISDTIRAYIEDRFSVHALESTTDEIMLAFRSQVVDTTSKEKLQQLLTLSDLVKFAKQFPVESEHLFTLQNAFDFVNGTKREEEVVLPPEMPTDQPAQISEQAKPMMEREERKEFFKSKITENSGSAGSLGKDISNRKMLLKILAAVIGAVVFLAIYHWINNSVSSGEEISQMKEISRQINKMCPKKLDELTVLDSTRVLPGKTFEYHYTLLETESPKFDVESFKRNVGGLLLKEVRTNPALKTLRERDVTMRYTYYDKTGKLLYMANITPADYKD